MTSRNFDKFAPAFNRAVSAYHAGKFDDAEQILQQIVAVQADHFDALHVLAVVQTAQRKNELALANYGRALAVQPNHADALSNRGNALMALDRFDAALASYDRALVARPDFAEALCNRGHALEKLGRLDEALTSYNRALALQADFVEALYNRGNALKALKRYDEALASYGRAIALRPGHADAHNNRGQALRELMRYEEALACYDRAIALQPQHVMAHCNAAALRLLLGDFGRGLPDYEWRWLKQSVLTANRLFRQPVWRGEPAAGKTILLRSEQGLGDTIQFCRYVPLVAAAGARVILEVQEPLRALMSGLGAAQVIAKGNRLPDFDIHCPLLSLPLAFGTRLETIPSTQAYLAAPARQAMEWQARLAATRRPRIGLAWSGRPEHERDRERSIGLRALLPLLETGATIVSLQKEVRAEDAAVLKEHGDILRFGEALADFSDTTGLMSQLDLIVAVDTSVAHLAGALAKPVWILVTHVPDWRWLLGRDYSPWYPTARLFRQDSTCTWDGAIARVHAAARKFVAGERR
ncbi:MAG TPA: tetratricopeptide repeat-containing glycosyltransferase family protein [Pseudolabrys sp.]|jgi:tetratricopeptide (TPR) repeat protein